MKRLLQSASWLAMGFSLASIASTQTIQINRDNKTIAISTTDEATATADIAAVTIGFVIYGPDAQRVTAEGAKLSHAILEALHRAEVDDKTIESSSQGVERKNDSDEKKTPEQQAREQFSFEQAWEVSVSPQLAAVVIRAAVAAGANKSGAIEWRLANRKALQAKAAENALVKARAVADRMAEGLHVKLGALIYASNEMPTTRLYFPGTRGAVVSGQDAEVPVDSLTPPLEIRPQTIREEATVYAVFAIE